MSYIAWLREKVGSQKIVLVYSSVVLHDDRGGVLLQRRADFDVWGLPGGVAEPGESILDCARRELREESGLAAGALRLVGVYSEPQYDTQYPNGDLVQQFTLCFQGTVNGGEMAVDGIENRAQAFFPHVQIPWVEMPHFYVAMVQDALAGRQAVYAPPYASAHLTDTIHQVRAAIGRAAFVAGGAIAVVVDAAQRLLVVKRTDDGEWSLPGGFTQLGENVAHTARREVREETGLEIELERLMGVSSPPHPWVYPNGDQTQSVAVVFQARRCGGALRPDLDETSQVGWVTLEEFLALETHPDWQRLNRAVAGQLQKGERSQAFLV
jgi:8-oxo-dGTP diphosphatase